MEVKRIHGRQSKNTEARLAGGVVWRVLRTQTQGTRKLERRVGAASMVLRPRPGVEPDTLDEESH